MKILQTPARFYPYIGGVENNAYYLSLELLKRGHDVTVICANEPDAKDLTNVNGIRVQRLKYIGKIANTNITLRLPFALRKTEFDLVHTHLPTPWSADWSTMVARRKKKPVVLTYHNDITGSGMARYIARLYNATSLNYILKHVDRIIITQPGYLHSSPYLKRVEHKIVIIPNGVDVEKFKPPNDANHASNVLFFLSILDEFHRYKGLDILLKALTIVKKDIPDIKLIVGGEGELRGEYQQMATSLGLNGTVEFHGFIPDDRLVEYYTTSNAFVLPSISSTQEGFGLVLLEALACGTPVISTDIVGVAADVKASNAGIIVSPNDPEALAEAILTLLRDAALASKMGESGRRLVEAKYTWERVAAMTEEVYEALL